MFGAGVMTWDRHLAQLMGNLNFEVIATMSIDAVQCNPENPAICFGVKCRLRMPTIPDVILVGVLVDSLCGTSGFRNEMRRSRRAVKL